ncbi:MAG: Sensor protein ZraS, partial [Verrucomicrobiota bacterium]
MGTLSARRRFVFSALFIAFGLAVCGWQVEEHVRFRRNAAEALTNRGRDITSTLGVLVRSQRRFGVVSKERLESQLQDLIRPKEAEGAEILKELEGVAILAATGEPIASAGARVELPPDLLQSKGVFWSDRSLTILNLMDLGATTGDDGSRPRPPTIVADERTRSALNPGANRRPPDAEPAPLPPEIGGDGAPARDTRPRFGQPSWMSRAEYTSMIQKQGVHSIVIALSTGEMRRLVASDLLLRALVSLLAMGGAVASMLAWRNVARNAELQIRLVKAGEANAHLKEMNLAAAGLAHETRNPLNLIRGFAQMIAMQAKEAPKLREHAGAIIEETDRVTVQLNEVIHYSKPREAHL